MADVLCWLGVSRLIPLGFYRLVFVGWCTVSTVEKRLHGPCASARQMLKMLASAPNDALLRDLKRQVADSSTDSFSHELVNSSGQITTNFIVLNVANECHGWQHLHKGLEPKIGEQYPQNGW